MITFTCPCGTPLKIPDSASGSTVACPKCHRPVKVPLAVAEIDTAPKKKDDPVASFLGGVALLILLGTCVWTAAIGKWKPSDYIPPAPPQAKQAAPKTEQSFSRSLRKGDTGYVEVPGESDVWLSVDEQTADRLTQLSTARDEAGIRQLMAAGRVLVVPAKTKVRVLAPGLLTTEVRILEGTHEGKSGLIPSEWVLR